MKFINPLSILFLIFIFSACSYDILEELEKDEVCVTEDMKFSTDIFTIIENNCLSCHHQGSSIGAGIVLDNYNDIRFWVEQESLLSVIKHKDGFPEMPKNASKLDDCDIGKIESWIYDGAPNN